MNYILSLDQGTTGTTALLINQKTLEIEFKCNFEFTQHFPKPGWVEHDLDEIWESLKKAINEVLKVSNIDTNQISCIGITNQRETTCAFNKSSSPLAKAIVWQDRRTEQYCEELKAKDLEKFFKSKAGLPLDPYFSGTKMQWLLNNNKNVQNAANKGELLFGTIDTYLLHRLSSGESFKTDASNASRTLLMDLEKSDWDNELLDHLNIDRSFLPDICDSFSSFGETKGLSFLPDGIPITCILGDQQAALFGQAGTDKGDMKCTYGTGAFLLLNTGNEIIHSENGLLTTLAYRHKGQAYYALEGSCYIAGAAVQWLRDNLKLINKSSDVEELARQIKSLDEMEHVMFLPFLTGIGSPYWKSNAKGAIVGLTRDTKEPHLAMACLEGVTQSIQDIIQAFEADSNEKLESLKVDGGAVANNLLLELQATFSDLSIIRPKVIETTAFGAGIGALIGLGEIQIEEVKKLWQEDKIFEPESKYKDYCSKKSIKWKSTIKKLYLD